MHSGFNRDFLDFFGYVDDAGSACGATLTQARQVVVDDVETASVFAEPERAMVLASGVRSVVSTPLLDERGSVRGAVSTHYAQPHRSPGADAVMPRVVAVVHAAAHAAAKTPIALNPAVVGGN
jgi:GAF domain-containing protein